MLPGGSDAGRGVHLRRRQTDNPYDGLVRIESNPAGTAPFKLTILANQWNSPSFAGAEKLRYISNSHFVRQGKVYVYGGGHELRNNTREAGKTLYAIDVTVPSMSVVSINNLPAGQRVEGEAILADRDPAKDILVATDGVRVNVFDFASGTWTSCARQYCRPTTTASRLRLPGAGRQGFWSPEIQQFVILGGHWPSLRVCGSTMARLPPPPPTPGSRRRPHRPAPSPSPVPAPAPPE